MKFFSFKKLKTDKTADDHGKRIAEIEKAQADIASRINTLKSQRIEKIAAGDDEGLAQIATEIRAAEEENENLVLALDLLRSKQAEAQAAEKIAALEAASRNFPTVQRQHKAKWAEMLQLVTERQETEDRLEREKRAAIGEFNDKIAALRDELNDLAYNAGKASSEAEALGRFDLVCCDLPQIHDPLAGSASWDAAFENENYKHHNYAWIGSKGFRAMNAFSRAHCSDPHWFANIPLPEETKARIAEEHERAKADEAQRAA